MEKRDAKILWNKNGKGNDTTRITLPVTWVRRMGITQDFRNVELCFDEEKNEIIIKEKMEKVGM
ncbi:MAG: hypothetical protein ACRCX2_36575 [Paraclostridium sp.]|uniref:AbrB/MazE/SpoVT family DNA-binding domain-containing protein n=1 Tax=Cetobacterium sp. TaxID=2071632 RepID=UPI003F3E2204